MARPKLAHGRIFDEEVADELKKVVVRSPFRCRTFVLEDVEIFEEFPERSEG